MHACNSSKPSPEILLRGAQRLLLHRLFKDLQRGRWLIKRHLVPRPKDPRKAQFAHILKRPRRRAADRVARQRRALERRLAAVGNRLRRGLVAEPVADPVGVSGVDDRLDTRFHHVGELREERAGVVARGGKLLVGRVGAFLVGGLGADGFDDGGGLEVVDVGFWGVGVVARGADVVDVEVGNLAEGPFDRVVADVVRIRAVGITAAGGTRLECGEALAVVGIEVGCVLGGGDERLVGVAVAEVDVGFLLQLCVKPSVIDA